MSRRALTLLIAAIGAGGALLVAAALPVPYVALIPGPTYNTLGPLGSKPIIQIQGHRTYQTPGHLNMVTISYLGGPGAQPPFSIFAALSAWLSPHDAVVPQTELFPAGQTAQQVTRADTEQMVNSQQSATAAALCQLGIKFAVVDTLSNTVAGLPAARVLKAGDRIMAVNARPITCRATAASLLGAVPVGRRMVITIHRAGRTLRVRIARVSYHGVGVIGVNLAESFAFPFTVKINIGDVGGPSAGMMFALGIVDKLTPLNLTGGAFIAGTGEISLNGAVGPIGGIQQKMAAARAAGATVFLTPAANCPDTAGAVPPGLRRVKVSSLAGAIAALRALKAGRPVPSC